jgi:superfamily II DNA or RNA helicase
MVETLKNRINDEKLHLDNVGLVIIDEAHYNSFGSYLVRLQMPLFLGYRNSFEFKYKITHARATMNCRDTISSLIDNGFLAKAITYSYDVGLTSLKVELTAIIPLNHQMICTLIWRCRRIACLHGEIIR